MAICADPGLGLGSHEQNRVASNLGASLTTFPLSEAMATRGAMKVAVIWD